MGPAEFIYTVLLKPRPLRILANAVLRSIIPRQVTRHGARLALNPNVPVVSGALTLNVYERPETEFFRKVCRPGLTVLDVGANLGYYTALAQSILNGAGRILALEPDPENFRFLKATMSLNPHPEIVTCYPAAASDQEGRLRLHTSADNRGDNRMYANELANGFVEVDVTTVDRLVAQAGHPVIDLVKIDVQGYEFSVVTGMRQTIAASPRMLLFSEFWPHGLSSAGASGEKYLDLLVSLGFKIYELGNLLQPVNDHRDLVSRYPGRAYTNLVAVRGTLADWGLGS